jgi:uncharacterized protein with HEPN domain
VTEPRAADLLAHIRQAAHEACGFLAGMSFEEFFQDLRTQKAVEMSLVVIGEAAARVLSQHPELARQHADLPWREMRGMRNRMAHGYFEIDLEVVWNTVQTALPALLVQLNDLELGEHQAGGPKL